MIYLATIDSWGWWPEDSNEYNVLIDADNEIDAKLAAGMWIDVHTSNLEIHGWSEDYIAKKHVEDPLYQLRRLEPLVFNAYRYIDLKGLTYET